jgi:acetyltransferase-like isoleucine patch superfamily enzyme
MINGILEAGELIIGNNVKFGKDINIKVRGRLEIGDNSIIGDRFTVNAENVTLGEYFYNGPTDSRGMLIGGGSSNFPYANLKIGSGMVCHTGHINLAAPVTIGNDVGLSHDVDLITHGF